MFRYVDMTMVLLKDPVITGPILYETIANAKIYKIELHRKVVSDHKPVYKLYAFHWIEVGLRKALWYLGNAIGGYSTTLMVSFDCLVTRKKSNCITDNTARNFSAILDWNGYPSGKFGIHGAIRQSVLLPPTDN